ncbi:glutaredoxin family protein [Brevibacillus centrosporus]|uniref:glutaredoxin family protein n=1 Tax=Brevibacillus centrosporus TaxID=54910 RepID=UPI0037FC9C78
MNITIYTSDHCSACREAIQFFQEYGIPYRQLDVGYDKWNFDEMLRLGGIATPLIIVGSQTFHTFDPKKMEEALQRHDG